MSSTNLLQQSVSGIISEQPKIKLQSPHGVRIVSRNSSSKRLIDTNAIFSTFSLQQQHQQLKLNYQNFSIQGLKQNVNNQEISIMMDNIYYSSKLIQQQSGSPTQSQKSNILYKGQQSSSQSLQMIIKDEHNAEQQITENKIPLHPNTKITNQKLSKKRVSIALIKRISQNNLNKESSERGSRNTHIQLSESKINSALELNDRQDQLQNKHDYQQYMDVQLNNENTQNESPKLDDLIAEAGFDTQPSSTLNEQPTKKISEQLLDLSLLEKALDSKKNSNNNVLRALSQHSLKQSQSSEQVWQEVKVEQVDDNKPPVEAHKVSSALGKQKDFKLSIFKIPTNGLSSTQEHSEVHTNVYSSPDEEAQRKLLSKAIIKLKASDINRQLSRSQLNSQNIFSFTNGGVSTGLQGTVATRFSPDEKFLLGNSVADIGSFTQALGGSMISSNLSPNNKFLMKNMESTPESKPSKKIVFGRISEAHQTKIEKLTLKYYQNHNIKGSPTLYQKQTVLFNKPQQKSNQNPYKIDYSGHICEDEMIRDVVIEKYTQMREKNKRKLQRYTLDPKPAQAMCDMPTFGKNSLEQFPQIQNKQSLSQTILEKVFQSNALPTSTFNKKSILKVRKPEDSLNVSEINGTYKILPPLK